MKVIQRSIFFAVCLSGLVATQVALAASGPRPPASPDVGLDGAANMHGDIASSDTTPLPGPGTSDVDVKSNNFLSACPTILIRTDGKPFVLCTTFLGRDPVVRLLKQRNGEEKASLKLEAGSLLGGVYAFIDNQDRLVMVDGKQNLVRIKAEKKQLWFRSKWELSIDESVSLADAVTGHCGGNACDAVVALSAGRDGTTWFVTQQSLVGVYDPATGSITTTKLASDERIDNSFSTTVDGLAAIATNRAFYVLQQSIDGQPQLLWRQDYDAGSARKPGNLSNGTGATPTFFGPENGTEFVMITDNADAGISLIIRHAETGNLVCEQPVFSSGASGTENSAIGIGSSVIVASTYGYPYPAVPEGAGPAVPEDADFMGGMVRVDVRNDQTDCDIVWENSVRSSAVPKLSTSDELIYTIERHSIYGDNRTSILDSYHFTAVDFHSGSVLKQSKIGSGFFMDTLQMAGNAGQDGVYWQGTIGGVIRISPRN